MYINLCFDYYSEIIYVPDGYINDLEEVYSNFFKWLETKSDYIVNQKGNNIVTTLSYDANSFIQYINEDILQNKEKSYIVKKKKYRKVYKLKF